MCINFTASKSVTKTSVVEDIPGMSIRQWKKPQLRKTTRERAWAKVTGKFVLVSSLPSQYEILKLRMMKTSIKIWCMIRTSDTSNDKFRRLLQFSRRNDNDYFWSEGTYGLLPSTLFKKRTSYKPNEIRYSQRWFWIKHRSIKYLKLNTTHRKWVQDRSEVRMRLGWDMRRACMLTVTGWQPGRVHLSTGCQPVSQDSPLVWRPERGSTLGRDLI